MEDYANAELRFGSIFKIKADHARLTVLEKVPGIQVEFLADIATPFRLGTVEVGASPAPLEDWLKTMQVSNYPSRITANPSSDHGGKAEAYLEVRWPEADGGTSSERFVFSDVELARHARTQKRQEGKAAKLFSVTAVEIE